MLGNLSNCLIYINSFNPFHNPCEVDTIYREGEPDSPNMK